MPGREPSPQTKLYPIPILIKSSLGDLRGQIKKLTLQGFLAEVPVSKIQPGEAVIADFALSGASFQLSVAGRVVKFYSQWSAGETNSVQTLGGKPAATIGHLLEVHFSDLPPSAVESISTFLRSGSKIGRR